MKKRPRMRIPVVVVGCFIAFATGGCFDLERADDLTGGVITGIVLDNEGQIAPQAIASLADIDRVAVVDAEGRFRFEGIAPGDHVVRLFVDADADGAPELGALRAVNIARLVDSDVVGGVDVGAVTLAPTGSVTGRVVDVDGQGVGSASVALWRNVALDNGELALDLAADLLATSAPDGRFVIDGVIVGDAEIAAFDVVGATTTRGSVPLPIDVRAAVPTEIGDQVLIDVADTRPARITFTRPVDDVVEIRLAPSGGVRPAEATIVVDNPDGTSIVRFPVPFGIWDVYVNVGTASAVLLAQVAPLLGGRDEVSWGVVDLVEGGNVAPVCGDGFIDDGEECDAGVNNAETGGAPCRLDCTKPNCGDGFVDDGEDCDDGVDVNSGEPGASCRVDCRLGGCGDGLPDPAEACDFGALNNDSCVPVGVDGCDFCSVLCDDGRVPSTATVVIDVRSAQGWSITPLAGVPVSFDGVTTNTNEDGFVALQVTLPNTSLVIVGGADAFDVDRAFVQRRLALPSGLVHGSTVTLKTAVHEGCFVDTNADNIDDGGKGSKVARLVDPGPDFSVNIGTLVQCSSLRQELSWRSGDQLRDRNGDPTTSYRVSVASPSDTGVDPLALVGFPETVDDAGALLQCDLLFDFRLQDGVHIDPAAAGQPLQLFAGLDPSNFAYRLNDDTGLFALREGVFDGQAISLPEDGTWCFGNAAQAPDACLVATVTEADGTPVFGANVEYVSRGGGVAIRHAVTDVDGIAGCLQVSLLDATISALAVDGRRVSSSALSFPNVSDASCAASTCGTITLTLPTVPFESCLVVRPVVTFGSDVLAEFDVLPTVPEGPLTLTESIKGESVPRGRLAWDLGLQQRCVAVPNDAFNLEVFYRTMHEASCYDSFGGNRFQSIDFRAQTPSSEPPQCGGDDCSVVDLNFFCTG